MHSNRHWLAAHDAKSDFTVPAALQDLPVTGCRILNARSRPL
jgi:hypothetical protein